MCIRDSQYPTSLNTDISSVRHNCGSPFHSLDEVDDRFHINYDQLNINDDLRSQFLFSIAKSLNTRLGTNVSNTFNRTYRDGTIVGRWLSIEFSSLISQFEEHFGYQNVKFIDVSTSDRSFNENAQLIVDQIDQCLPVLLDLRLTQLDGTQVGHTIIVDAYFVDENNLTRFHANFGWGSAGINEIIDLNEAEFLREVGFEESFRIEAIYYDIAPPGVNSCFNRKSIEVITDYSKNNKSLGMQCPSIVYPFTEVDYNNNRLDVVWNEIENADHYLFSLKNVSSGEYIYQDTKTLPSAFGFSADYFLEVQSIYEVTIKPVDKNGNVLECSSQILPQITFDCRLFLTNLNTICNQDGSYNVEIDFNGEISPSYDVFCEWDGFVYASTGGHGVEPGYYVLGPIPAGQEIAIIVENEVNPLSCNLVELLHAPSCLSCPEFSFSSSTQCINENFYDLLIDLDGSSTNRYDIVNGTVGVEHENVCLLYTSPSPRDRTRSRMPSSA